MRGRQSKLEWRGRTKKLINEEECSNFLFFATLTTNFSHGNSQCSTAPRRIGNSKVGTKESEKPLGQTSA